ncbi:MAG TPA: bile acid:sodium symporter family protein [Spirochaetota bacterium]|nr:bile acid:sodium symporter family protein [Spirochaetota bacterium]HPI89281.1 bile acid:sodium symporter family protein [Spirochaetota bacterium]HPR48559.1 bile acid:sodium symporter family protein [Spirochaetota bacterium]
MKTVLFLSRLFLVWVLLFSLAAWLFPGIFAKGVVLINPGLGVIMFGMGMTLTAADFGPVFRNPAPVILGLCLQFVLMPSIAWMISQVFGFTHEISAGFVLLGSCPGGTASNVITFLAGGNVALSVTMTTISTLLSPVMTPLLTGLFASKWVTVPYLSMFISIVLIIIVPVAAGVLVHSLAGKKVASIQPAFQLLSVIAIAFIIAVIIDVNRDRLSGDILPVCAGVVAHNLTGLGAAYGIARLLKINERDSITIGIEVGMQNSGLSVKLALEFFSSAAALPGALFSIWHNISGAVIAFLRRSRG